MQDTIVHVEEESVINFALSFRNPYFELQNTPSNMLSNTTCRKQNHPKQQDIYKARNAKKPARNEIKRQDVCVARRARLTPILVKGAGVMTPMRIG
jgi:hypothetical protein